MRTVPVRILIIDNEPIGSSTLEDELGAAGYVVTMAASLLDADRELASFAFDVVVISLLLPRQDSLSFLQDARKRNPAQAMIVLTDYNNIGTAVEAMKLGAFDYIQKPFFAEELLLKMDKLLRYERMVSENENLRHQIILRRFENQIIPLDNTDHLEPAETLALAMPGESGNLLSLKLPEIERVDIGTVLDEVETRLIHWALEEAEGNLTKAAELLGLPRSTLQYKINRRTSSTNSLPNQS
jgi:DNA-binding NtrC family response regulator